MSRLVRSLVSAPALGMALGLTLTAPVLAQTNDGPVLLVPQQGAPATTTNPAYGQEFNTAPAQPAPSMQAAPLDSQAQSVGSYPVTPAQPMDAQGGTPTTQGRMVTPDNTEAATDARSSIAEAEATVVRLTRNSGFKKELTQLMDQAKAIMVIPSFYKAGFIVGAAYGNGLLMTRDANGVFSDPAFYQLTAGSVGFQAGLQENEVVMVIMTNEGLEAVMKDQFKGGANASVTFFLVGGGAEAATTTDVGEDIYAFSHSVGLFGGAGLEGTAIQPKTSWNDAIYGVGVTPETVLFQRSVGTPLAQGLKRALVER